MSFDIKKYAPTQAGSTPPPAAAAAKPAPAKPAPAPIVPPMLDSLVKLPQGMKQEDLKAGVGRGLADTAMVAGSVGVPLALSAVGASPLLAALGFTAFDAGQQLMRTGDIDPIESGAAFGAGMIPVPGGKFASKFASPWVQRGIRTTGGATSGAIFNTGMGAMRERKENPEARAWDILKAAPAKYGPEGALFGAATHAALAETPLGIAVFNRIRRMAGLPEIPATSMAEMGSKAYRAQREGVGHIEPRAAGEIQGDMDALRAKPATTVFNQQAKDSFRMRLENWKRGDLVVFAPETPEQMVLRAQIIPEKSGKKTINLLAPDGSVYASVMKNGNLQPMAEQLWSGPLTGRWRTFDTAEGPAEWPMAAGERTAPPAAAAAGTKVSSSVPSGTAGTPGVLPAPPSAAGMTPAGTSTTQLPWSVTTTTPAPKAKAPKAEAPAAAPAPNIGSDQPLREVRAWGSPDPRTGKRKLVTYIDTGRKNEQGQLEVEVKRGSAATSPQKQEYSKTFINPADIYDEGPATGGKAERRVVKNANEKAKVNSAHAKVMEEIYEMATTKYGGDLVAATKARIARGARTRAKREVLANLQQQVEGKSAEETIELMKQLIASGKASKPAAEQPLTAPPSTATGAAQDRGPMYDANLKRYNETPAGEVFHGAPFEADTYDRTAKWAATIPDGTTLETPYGLKFTKNGTVLEAVNEDGSRGNPISLGNRDGSFTRDQLAIFAESRIVSRSTTQATSTKPTVDTSSVPATEHFTLTRGQYKKGDTFIYTTQKGNKIPAAVVEPWVDAKGVEIGQSVLLDKQSQPIKLRYSDTVKAKPAAAATTKAAPAKAPVTPPAAAGVPGEPAVKRGQYKDGDTVSWTDKGGHARTGMVDGLWIGGTTKKELGVRVKYTMANGEERTRYIGYDDVTDAWAKNKAEREAKAATRKSENEKLELPWKVGDKVKYTVGKKNQREVEGTIEHVERDPNTGRPYGVVKHTREDGVVIEKKIFGDSRKLVQPPSAEASEAAAVIKAAAEESGEDVGGVFGKLKSKLAGEPQKRTPLVRGMSAGLARTGSNLAEFGAPERLSAPPGSRALHTLQGEVPDPPSAKRTPKKLPDLDADDLKGIIEEIRSGYYTEKGKRKPITREYVAKQLRLAYGAAKATPEEAQAIIDHVARQMDVVGREFAKATGRSLDSHLQGIRTSERIDKAAIQAKIEETDAVKAAKAKLAELTGRQVVPKDLTATDRAQFDAIVARAKEQGLIKFDPRDYEAARKEGMSAQQSLRYAEEQAQGRWEREHFERFAVSYGAMKRGRAMRIAEGESQLREERVPGATEVDPETGRAYSVVEEGSSQYRDFKETAKEAGTKLFRKRGMQVVTEKGGQLSKEEMAGEVPQQQHEAKLREQILAEVEREKNTKGIGPKGRQTYPRGKVGTTVSGMPPPPMTPAERRAAIGGKSPREAAAEHPLPEFELRPSGTAPPTHRTLVPARQAMSNTQQAQQRRARVLAKAGEEVRREGQYRTKVSRLPRNVAQDQALSEQRKAATAATASAGLTGAPATSPVRQRGMGAQIQPVGGGYYSTKTGNITRPGAGMKRGLPLQGTQNKPLTPAELSAKIEADKTYQQDLTDLITGRYDLGKRTERVGGHRDVEGEYRGGGIKQIPNIDIEGGLDIAAGAATRQPLTKDQQNALVQFEKLLKTSSNKYLANIVREAPNLPGEQRAKLAGELFKRGLISKETAVDIASGDKVEGKVIEALRTPLPALPSPPGGEGKPLPLAQRLRSQIGSVGPGTADLVRAERRRVYGEAQQARHLAAEAAELHRRGGSTSAITRFLKASADQAAGIRETLQGWAYEGKLGRLTAEEDPHTGYWRDIAGGAGPFEAAEINLRKELRPKLDKMSRADRAKVWEAAEEAGTYYQTVHAADVSSAKLAHAELQLQAAKELSTQEAPPWTSEKEWKRFQSGVLKQAQNNLATAKASAKAISEGSINKVHPDMARLMLKQTMDDLPPHVRDAVNTYWKHSIADFQAIQEASVASGLISADMAAKFKARGDYAGAIGRLGRVWQENAAARAEALRNAGAGSLAETQLLDPFEGISTDPTISALDNAIRSRMGAWREVARNNATRRLVDLHNKVEPGSVRLLKEGERLQVGEVSLPVWRDGVRENWAVPQKYAIPMASASEEEIASSMLGMRFLRWTRDLFVKSATMYSTGFAVSNPWRDVSEAMDLARTRSGQRLYPALNPLARGKVRAEWFKHFNDALREHDDYVAMIRAQAGQSTMSSGISPKVHWLPYFKIVKGQHVPTVASKGIVPVFMDGRFQGFRVSEITNAMEHATKLMTWRRAKALGVSDAEAADIVREWGGSPDFGKHGTYGRWMSVLATFMNPNIQERRRTALTLADTIRGDKNAITAGARKSAFRVATGVLLGHTMLSNWNDQFVDEDGKPELNHVDRRIKENNTIIMLPYMVDLPTGERRWAYVRLPRSFPSQIIHAFVDPAVELARTGKISGSTMDRVNSMTGILLPGNSQWRYGDPRTDQGDAWNSVINWMSSNAHPVAGLLMDLHTGRSASTGGDIEPRRTEKLSKELRYRPTTDPSIVNFVHKLAAWDIPTNWLGMSPSQLQYGIERLAPGPGRLLFTALSMAAEKRGLYASPDQTTWGKVRSAPGVGPMLSRYVGPSNVDEELAERRDRLYKVQALIARARGDESQADLKWVTEFSKSPEARQFLDNPALMKAVSKIIEKKSKIESRREQALLEMAATTPTPESRKALQEDLRFLYEQEKDLLERFDYYMDVPEVLPAPPGSKLFDPRTRKD